MPESSRIFGFHHLTFWVGNAKQSAAHYTARMGFEAMAYKGLETGSREVVSHVVKQGKIIFEFQSPLNPGNRDMGEHLIQHGDGVKDISFEVEDIDSVFSWAKEGGAKIIHDVWEEEDDCGKARFAKVLAFGDVTHTFVERSGYKGLFLPGYKKPIFEDPLVPTLPPGGLDFIDHVAGNQEENGAVGVVEWYESNMKFHQFWSIDGSQIRTKYNALNTKVMTNDEETIKLSINEPEPGQQTSQIQEFVNYYGGPGVQHIAFHTDDIITSVTNLKARGVEFLVIPDAYYDDLRKRLNKAKINVAEDIDKLQKLQIVVDFDDHGYLLQIFTTPVQDRPTLFLELIQRHNHQGFGQNNFRLLFEAIERYQNARGNLHESINGI